MAAVLDGDVRRVRESRARAFGLLRGRVCVEGAADEQRGNRGFDRLAKLVPEVDDAEDRIDLRREHAAHHSEQRVRRLPLDPFPAIGRGARGGAIHVQQRRKIRKAADALLGEPAEQRRVPLQALMNEPRQHRKVGGVAHVAQDDVRHPESSEGDGHRGSPRARDFQLDRLALRTLEQFLDGPEEVRHVPADPGIRGNDLREASHAFVELRRELVHVIGAGGSDADESIDRWPEPAHDFQTQMRAVAVAHDRDLPQSEGGAQFVDVRRRFAGLIAGEVDAQLAKVIGRELGDFQRMSDRSVEIGKQILRVELLALEGKLGQRASASALIEQDDVGDLQERRPDFACRKRCRRSSRSAGQIDQGRARILRRALEADECDLDFARGLGVGAILADLESPDLRRIGQLVVDLELPGLEVLEARILGESGRRRSGRQEPKERGREITRDREARRKKRSMHAESPWSNRCGRSIRSARSNCCDGSHRFGSPRLGPATASLRRRSRARYADASDRRRPSSVRIARSVSDPVDRARSGRITGR